MAHQHRLHQPHQTRSPLRMAQIRLRRPHHHTRRPKHLAQRARLDRVAQRSPRPMRLHIPHRTRPHRRIRQRRTDHLRLRRAVRHRKPARRAVLTHRAATQLRPGPPPPLALPLALPPRPAPRQAQHHDRAPLRPPIPVRPRRKRLAPAIRRQHPRPRKPHRVRRQKHQAHPAHQRQIALPGPQRTHRQVHRHQRRRARRVHRHRRAPQPKRIRQPPRRHRMLRPRRMIRIDRAKPARHRKLRVVRPADPHINPNPPAPQPRRVKPGILQSLPPALQKQTLLRVHPRRLPRTDPPETGVETIHRTQPAPPNRPNLPSRMQRRQTGTKRTTARRNIRRHITARSQNLPKPGRRTYPPRKTQTNSQNRCATRTTTT